MPGAERRRYARHPMRVPVAVRPRGVSPDFRSSVADLSEGGLAFDSSHPFALETAIDLSFPIADQRFDLVGSVARCDPGDNAVEYRIGVAFLHPTMSFRMKLAEQVLRIQELRRELSRERGHEVSNEEAAQLWVDEHAAEFAELYR